ncbi:hypothetical protein LCGC14_1348190 [marine sediment metagenome]|uniref:DNA methylase N-4/N-6 domain-containing protein n=1 Tax=marine sediment metagenome TaxID=412755 RepID=A0A0F9KXR6_9ZZZZ
MKPYYETKLGKLYHGDCLEIIPELEPVDLVLTDPPYGKTQNTWDDLQATISAFDMMKDTNTVFTCQNPSTALLIARYIDRFKWADIWNKSHATGFLNCHVMPLRQHEDIIVLSCGKMTYNPQIIEKDARNIRPHGKPGQSDNYGKFNDKRERTIAINETYPRSIIYCDCSQNGLHPNEKPVKLFDQFVLTYSNETDTIRDPFVGSGVTAISCERMNRHWQAIEISEKYCEIAAKRIDKEIHQLSRRLGVAAAFHKQATIKRLRDAST